MQILARIPVLSVVDEPSAGWAAPPSSDAAIGMSVSSAAACDEPSAEASADSGEHDGPSLAAVERPRAARLPAPSILVLSVLAVAMWMAALRNDRLRLEAARQARAERLAEVVPGVVGTGGSRTR
jgi:hypothetical protein